MLDRLRSLALIIAAMVRADPLRTALSILLLTAGRLSVLGTVYGLKVVADAVSHGNSVSMLRGAWLLGGSIALGLAAKYPIASVGVTLRERSVMAIEQRMIRLVAGLPTLEHFERPEYLDQVQLIRRSSFELGEAVSSIVDNLATLALMLGSATLLVQVHPVLILLPFAAIPAFVAASIKERMRRRYDDEAGPLWRAMKGLRDDIAWQTRYAPELRLFGAAETIMRRQREAADEIARKRNRWAIRGGLAQTAGDTVLAIANVVAIGFIALRVVNGSAPVGDLLLTAILAARVNDQVVQTIEGITWLWRLLVVVGRLQLLTGQTRVVTASGLESPPTEMRSGIDVVDVSFRYPGTETDVLTDINLHLPAGSSIALVGENGAGKTTLAKLLSRFYEPTSGRVEVDGVDIADLDVQRWRDSSTAVFQDFARLEILARESIGVGDVPLVEDATAVLTAIDRADARPLMEALPDGLETQLGKRFPNGTELSTGQWQQVALARARMRGQLLLIILDEPTAALDPQAEHALFEGVASAMRDNPVGAITLFVSHRFSTVRMADRVVVIDKGRIAEEGTHDELMKAGGLYSELYRHQASSYS